MKSTNHTQFARCDVSPYLALAIPTNRSYKKGTPGLASQVACLTELNFALSREDGE